MIVIIDYGAGNLQSIINAFELLGERVEVINSPEKLKDAEAIVLPGVGAFSDCMNNLRKAGFIDALNREVIEKKKPFLGICLGLQILAEQSFEHGCYSGFGWVKGSVKKIIPKSTEFKIPHMGWNNIIIRSKDRLFRDFENEPVFYFVHSYTLVLDELDQLVTSTCYHGAKIVASVQKENIFGVQFHPEKSQGAGLKLLKNFITFVREDA